MSSDESSGNETGEASNRDMKRLSGVIANIFIIANKNKAQVKRSQISQLIPKELKKETNRLIEGAAQYLQKVFGYKIVKLDNKGTYITVTTLDSDINDYGMTESPSSKSELSAYFIRMNLLIAIFMNLGVMSEGQVKEFLLKFGADIESKRKDQWGDVNKFIFTDLVRQNYIEIKEITAMNPPVKEFRWGQRAQLEMTKEKVLKFVCKIYGDHYEPKMWTEQFKSLNINNE